MTRPVTGTGTLVRLGFRDADEALGLLGVLGAAA